MCGIAGIYRKNKPVSLTELKQMSDRLIHRGPDGEGQWLGTKKNLGLTHRRLSIIDLSDNALQPMQSNNKRFTITFNGEIYNYIEIKEELINKGYKFNSQSDTEVLLCAFQEYGEAFLYKLDGMFAFAIWDEQKQELFCARDRFGEKPFFYYYDSNEFLFASEMKAIWKKGIPKETNDKMIFLYLSQDIIENPNNKKETFYKNIYKLPAGHTLKITKNFKLATQKYWSLDNINIKNNYNKKEKLIEEFNFLLENSVKKRLRANVNIGSSLSGGLDSSSVVAVINKIMPSDKQYTFTAKFDDPDLDESKYVKFLESKLNLNSYFKKFSNDVLEKQLDTIFYHQEEPFGSASIVAQWEVMKLARQHNVTVLLDGQGADETIAGYFKYIPVFLSELYKKDKNKYVKQNHLLEKNLNISLKIPHTNIPNVKLFRKLKRIVKNPYPYLNNEFFSSFAKDEFIFPEYKSLNDSLKFDTKKYGLEKLLRFADRNSMAHSREIRLPFLNHHLVEFLFSLPAEFKINDGWTKWILRESMKDRLPSEIVWRKDKMGYQAPQHKWMNNKIIQEKIKITKQYLINKKMITTSFNDDWRLLMLSYMIKQ